jgi:hypothetical protein
MHTDPLDQDDHWFYPTLSDQQSIPRNFKLATEIRRSVQPYAQLEFVFFNFVTNEVIVVDPLDSLKLMVITIESEDLSRYISTAIDVSDWISLKSQLVYIGLV